MAFLANPTARFTHYVDPTTGSSAGPGSSTAPWATLDQGIGAVPTTVAAVGGATGVIVLAGTAASPNTYVSTAGLTVSGRLTIQAANTSGAKVAGNGTAQAISLASGGNLSLTGIILDPSLNNGGAAAVGITIPSTVAKMTLTCTNVTFQGWTDFALSAAAGLRLDFTATNCTWSASDINGAILFNRLDSGDVVITGGSSTLTNQLTAGSSGGNVVVIGSAGTTGTVIITNFSTSTTLKSTLTGSGVHYGIRIYDVPGAQVVGTGTHDILGAPGSRVGACVLMDFDSNTLTGNKITGQTGTNTTNGGYVFAIGNEPLAGAPTQGTGCLISGNTATASASARAGGVHNLFMGGLASSTITQNVVTDAGLGIVTKVCTAATVSYNTITGFNSSGVRVKGDTNTNVLNNTFTQTAGYSGAVFIDCGFYDPSNFTIGTVITSNTFNVAGGTAIPYLKKESASDTATPTNNVYNLTSGSLASFPWQWGSANYTTLAAWKAGVESTATGTAP